MKKTLVFLIYIITFINIDAQEWTTINSPTDELKGTKEITGYFYTEKNIGYFMPSSSMENQFVISNNEEFFNYKDSSFANAVSATIGLYDENNNLIDKFFMLLVAPIDEPSMAFSLNKKIWKKKVQKIMGHLNSVMDMLELLHLGMGKVILI